MGFVGDVRSDGFDTSLYQNDLFDDFIELYLAHLESDSGCDDCQRQVVAILASAETPAACSLLRNANILRLAHVNVRVIFGSLSPIEMVAPWFDQNANFMFGDVHKQFRWVKNTGLLDAHEQVVLGGSMCWSGDTMRRTPHCRDSFELFEDSSLGMARLGRLAFESLWSACAKVPAVKLKVANKILSGEGAPVPVQREKRDFVELDLPVFAGTRH